MAIILLILVTGAVRAFKAAEGLVLNIGDAGVWHGAFSHQIVNRREKVATHAAIILIVTVDHFLWG